MGRFGMKRWSKVAKAVYDLGRGVTIIGAAVRPPRADEMKSDSITHETLTGPLTLT